MRNFFVTILSILSTATSLRAQPGIHSIFNSTDSTIITGKVEGYSPNQEEQFINYFNYDITGRQQKFFAPIQKGGKFSFKLLQQYEGEIAIQYGANFIKLYSKPGELIEIDIDNNVADKVFHFPGAFKIKGPSSEISNHILKFFQIYLPRLDERSASYSLLQGTDTFIKQVQRYLQDDLLFLDKYELKNNPPHSFRTWAKNWLVYEAAGMIAIKPFLGRINSAVSDTLLLKWLENIPIQNENALHNASYYEFINRLTGGFQMMINRATVYTYTPSNPPTIHLPDSIKIPDSILKRLTDSIRKNSPNAIPRESPTPIIKALDKVDQYMSGLVREIGYYGVYAFNTYSEATAYKLDLVWDRFDEVIKDNFIQQTLEEKRNSSLKTFVSFNVLDKINHLSVDSLLKKNLLVILQKEKGKYVYIDFWGAWCKPCMAEMPYYKAFIDEMKNEPISFLFLSVETSLKDMKSTKEKYNIPATFVSLNKNDTDIANEAFGFSGYPSHFLIDPKGNLVTGKLMISINHHREAAAQLKRYMK